jgi:hypothetical protein
MLKVYLETIFQLYPQLITRLVVKSGLFAYLQTISTILLPFQISADLAAASSSASLGSLIP